MWKYVAGKKEIYFILGSMSESLQAEKVFSVMDGPTMEASALFYGLGYG